jgi:hypothetical protein
MRGVLVTVVMTSLSPVQRLRASADITLLEGLPALQHQRRDRPAGVPGGYPCQLFGWVSPSTVSVIT